MVKLVPARIENGSVVPESPLPSASDVRCVSILLEVAEPAAPAMKESTLPRLLRILKEDVDDSRQQYREFLQRKYG